MTLTPEQVIQYPFDALIMKFTAWSTIYGGHKYKAKSGHFIATQNNGTKFIIDMEDNYG